MVVIAVPSLQLAAGIGQGKEYFHVQALVPQLAITVDNGTEFASKAMDLWAYTNGVHLDFIRPGKPVENGHVESLDGAGYTYDNAGNRTAKTNYLNNNTTENYTYDPLYQLTQVAQGATTTESYSYDPVGNRLSSLGMSPYAYNSSNQLTSTPAATFTYDGNGNTLTKVGSAGTTTYTWDFENRLTSVALPGSGGTVTFKYDPFGRRIQKSSSNGTTNYLYDGSNSVAEVDASGTLLARYAQGAGIDEPLAELRGGTAAFYDTDGLGSVTSLSDSTSSLVNTYTYDAFGNVAALTGVFTNPFQYTGRDADSETGLRYYRARYYDPSAGRFLGEDPRRFLEGVNFYEYVLNNPNRFRDPTGLATVGGFSPKCLADVLAAIQVIRDRIRIAVRQRITFRKFSRTAGRGSGRFQMSRVLSRMSFRGSL